MQIKLNTIATIVSKGSAAGHDASPIEGRVPTSFHDLAALLQARMDSLTPGQQRLARRVLSDPEGCAFMTVSDLAQAVEVNEATVVRFARSLGIDGYPALSGLCRQALREQAQLVQRFESLQGLGGSDGDLLQAATTFDRSNIVRTFARIDTQDWDRAVAALSESSSVYVTGARKCYAVAYLLGYLLGLVRDGVESCPIGPGTFPDLLRRVAPGDAFVGVSVHRYARETLQAVAFAHRRGATTIALTDNEASPLVPHADVVLYVETSSPTILRSLTAFVSLIQALATAVAARLGTNTRSALLLQEEVLREFDVYVANEKE
jgi:DNA-binding MurR/RpiR family transcriptional regulator